MAPRVLVISGIVTLLCFVGLLCLYMQVDTSQALPRLFESRTNPTMNISMSEAFWSRYVPPASSHLTTNGTIFKVDRILLTKTGIPSSSFIELNNRTVRDHVFVIGASSDHFVESRDTVASIQRNMPNTRILYYGMRLRGKEENHIRSFCNVEYRKFDFSKYPPHVSNLHGYSFKPLIVQECLKEHPGCIWFDASIRLKENLESVYHQIVATDGFLAFENTGFKIWRTTHRKLYDYLPANISLIKEVPQFGSGSVAFYRTSVVYKGIVYWWVLCALDPECTNPKGAKKGCDFKHTKITEWAKCHRYDQSTLNILVTNTYPVLNMYMAHKQIVHVERSPTRFYKEEICK